MLLKRTIDILRLNKDLIGELLLAINKIEVKERKSVIFNRIKSTSADGKRKRLPFPRDTSSLFIVSHFKGLI